MLISKQSRRSVHVIKQRWSQLPDNDIITNLDKADIKYHNWGANCGLQFRHYQGSISFFLRSCLLGFLFAPVVLFFVATIWKLPTLSSTRKTIAVCAVILPALLTLVATIHRVFGAI